MPRGPLLDAQRATFAPLVKALATTSARRRAKRDPVDAWRFESSRATLRFLDRMIAEGSA